MLGTKGGANRLGILADLNRQIDQRRNNRDRGEETRDRSWRFPTCRAHDIGRSTNERVQRCLVEAGFGVMFPC